MKVWIYTHDPILTLCYTTTEATELFGEYALEEDGTDVPEDLVEEITATYKKLLELSQKLEKIRQNS